MAHINILRVITWLPVGGIERRLVAVLPRLDPERFNVSLVCIRKRGPLAEQLEAAGIPVDCIPFKKRWDWRALARLTTLMRERRIDIVHSHMYRSNVPATVAARFARVPVVWAQVHNMDTWQTRRQVWVDRWLCRWRTGMIAVSDQVRRDVIHNLRLPEEKVRVLYNGVDVDRFAHARARRDAIRQREGVGEHETVFIFAARLVEKKRCTDFLEAFGRLQTASGGEHLRAWVLGDGALAETLKAQAAALPQPRAVHFYGMRQQIEDYLVGGDVFVLPSIREGFSNGLVEAMASGLAIVATDVGGNAEAVRTGRDGLIVPHLQVDQLTDAMDKLWRWPKVRLAMGISASLRAREFSLDAMVAQLENLYCESMRNAQQAP